MDPIQMLALGCALAFILIWLACKVFASPFANIPGPPSSSFLEGNFRQLTDRLGSERWTKQLVGAYGPISKLTAPFGHLWLHVYDPRALYSITIKDQEIWEKRMSSFNTLLLGPGLLTTEGSQHRKQRKMLTSAFSTAHLRNATPLFYETAHKLRDAIEGELREGPREIDVLQWMGRTALELIGQGALGYSFDPLVGGASDSFAESVKQLFGALNQVPAVVRMLASRLCHVGPAWMRRMIVAVIPNARIQRLKGIVDTIHQRSVEIMEEKKSSIRQGDSGLIEQIGEGRDVMSILLKANMAANAKERLSDDEIVAQMSTFILAGTDTTSNVAARLLHILAQNPDAQDRLCAEVIDTQLTDVCDYDQLLELPYLDAVCRETLRLYPPVRILSRCALKNTTLPLSEPMRGVDGTSISEIPVRKGTIAVLNLWASNTTHPIPDIVR
ncbi:cytochrome P450 [Trametes gibbosa]|nr:cytochrome P450 [Trametes gibbosa]